MNTLVPILVALAALVGDGTKPTVTSPSAPGAVDAKPKVQLDPCKHLPADATATLVRLHQSAAVQSDGIAYRARTRECRRFIADIVVPKDAMGPSGAWGGSTPDYKVAGKIVSLPNDEAACTATTLAITTYQKPAGASTFQLRTTAKYKGYWIPSGLLGAGCNIGLVSGEELPQDEPNPAGAEVWRVLLDASTNGTPLVVRAEIAFGVVPP